MSPALSPRQARPPWELPASGTSGTTGTMGRQGLDDWRLGGLHPGCVESRGICNWVAAEGSYPHSGRAARDSGAQGAVRVVSLCALRGMGGRSDRSDSAGCRRRSAQRVRRRRASRHAAWPRLMAWLSSVPGIAVLGTDEVAGPSPPPTHSPPPGGGAPGQIFKAAMGAAGHGGERTRAAPLGPGRLRRPPYGQRSGGHALPGGFSDAARYPPPGRT
jgi:hypothetical protein